MTQVTEEFLLMTNLQVARQHRAWIDAEFVLYQKLIEHRLLILDVQMYHLKKAKRKPNMDPMTILVGRLSDVRHMIHIVSSVSFTTMYRAAKDKTYIDSVIASCDRKAFDNWVHTNRTLADLSIRELRVVAHSKQIPYYSRMDKSTLIEEINNADLRKDRPTSGGYAPNNDASQDR